MTAATRTPIHWIGISPKYLLVSSGGAIAATMRISPGRPHKRYNHVSRLSQWIQSWPKEGAKPMAFCMVAMSFFTRSNSGFIKMGLLGWPWLSTTILLFLDYSIYLSVLIWRCCDLAIARNERARSCFPDRQIVRSSDRQMVRSPDYQGLLSPILKSPNRQIAKSPNGYTKLCGIKRTISLNAPSCTVTSIVTDPNSWPAASSCRAVTR